MKDFTEIEGGLLVAEEFVAAGMAAGVKSEGLDLMLLHSKVPATAAATITSNRFRAAPTYVTKRHIADGSAQTVVANSGNANCATGSEGMRNAERMAALAAQETGVPVEQALVCSTGRIGVQLPIEVIEAAIPQAAKMLSRDNAELAARAIMTTDTVPKQAAVEFEAGGRRIGLGAIAKGAGMICPNMATMLCFICTDLAIAQEPLQVALSRAVSRSFNCISVDGDMSTNDTVIALANGVAGNDLISAPEGPDFERFQSGLSHVTRELAKMIARDGEGSTKFVTVNVTGGASYQDAYTVARRITNYTLVKTCIWGGDFNWGRIAAAAGAADVDFDPATVQISIGGVLAFAAGEPVEYDAAAGAEAMKGDVEITVDLGMGGEQATCWTCDITPTFVELNV
ncbi:MAG: bifunctional glutamate N-acetyltransferase/amino-acid acetyltransferase ArgJ [candidate division WS1 bacterium]|jgi:glutamate N-acetyltransferase/amino-acid N-acetyltransferase|nr:bifunctional glutamate N-acetyltransferase/amino-acid acetyltransferase ArgJ [candidate division WS1 bacterium]